MSILSPVLLAHPVASGGNDSFTKLLLHMDGTDASTTFTGDSASSRTISVSGDAQIDTAQSKFGESGLFDGAGDFIGAPDSADWSLGTTDWTFDMWLRGTTLALNEGIFEHYINGNDFFGLVINSENFLRFKAVTGGVTAIDITSSLALVVDTWYHVAVVCDSGTITIYIDGVDKANGTRAAAMPNPTSPLYIGFSFYMFVGSYYWNGHIDEFRISTNKARWTTGFTPPTVAYF